MRPRWSLIRYYGPAAGVGDIKTMEMATAADFLSAYHATQDVVNLNKLIAVLYRPTNCFIRLIKLFNGRDVRYRFNSDTVDSRAYAIARLPLHVKQAILIMFTGYLNTLEQCTPNIPRSGETNHYGWVSIPWDLAGPVLGDAEKVKKMYAMDALMWLDKECYDNKKRKSEQPRV